MPNHDHESLLNQVQGLTIPDTDPPGVAAFSLVGGVNILVGIILLLLTLLQECLERYVGLLGLVLVATGIFALLRARAIARKNAQLAEQLEQARKAKRELIEMLEHGDD